MVRLRTAAQAAAALPAPRRARRVLLAATVLAAAVLAGCSSAAVRGEPSNLGVGPRGPLAGTVLPGHDPSIRSGVVRSPAERAVLDAWGTAQSAFFYRAAPAAPGDGARWTASGATRLLVAGRWLVLSDRALDVSSPKAAGPCHGF